MVARTGASGAPTLLTDNQAEILAALAANREMYRHTGCGCQVGGVGGGGAVRRGVGALPSSPVRSLARRVLRWWSERREP